MAQPERDDRSVDAVLQELHRGAMTEHMGRDALGPEGRHVFDAAHVRAHHALDRSRLRRSPRLLTNSGSLRPALTSHLAAPRLSFLIGVARSFRPLPMQRT